MNMFATLKAAATAVIVLQAASAVAATSPDTKCKASKNKIAGAYYACRQKAEAKAVMKNLLPPDYSKCAAAFAEKWTKAETDGAGVCPDNDVLPNDIDALVTSQASETASLIAGIEPPPAPDCGDDAINVAGEQCDGTDLGGLTCATFGREGTLSCTAGCEIDASGCSTCPAGTTNYYGTCWTLSTVAGNCDAACASAGMAYNDATLMIPGSSGSDANCIALLDALGAPGGVLDNSGNCPGAAVGCAVLPDFEFRARCVTPATTSSGSLADARRVCACE